ncbi:MAG: response regulator [Nitrospirota bacterium]
MKRVLIVDDEEDMVWSLKRNLRNGKLYVDIFTARSGEEALEFLKKVSVDLIITDIKMPGMSGLDLLLNVRKLCPQTGVIVMTAYPTPEFRKDALFKGCLHFIEKPFDIKHLRKAVKLALEEDRGFKGTVTGIDLTDIIQINCISKVTAALRVRTASREGILFFKDGRIVNAICENLEGEEALYEILGFEGGTLESIKGAETPTETILKGYEALLMEGLRRLDEAKRDMSGQAEGGRVKEPEKAVKLKEKEDLLFDIEEIEQETNSQSCAEEEKMALETYLQRLKEIKGYKAAGIMNFTGEMLANDSNDKNIDLDIVGATFNDIFRSAHEASKKIGLEACKEAVISTPKGIVVMRCSGVDAKSHFHLIGIMAADGNQALMKMQIEKMVPEVMAELG